MFEPTGRSFLRILCRGVIYSSDPLKLLALVPGSWLGAYEVLALLGSGGMGEVYRAKDTKLNRDVALKILPDIFRHDPERLARFRREAQVLAALSHPHIGAIYGLDEAGGTQFLVLELVDGESLDRRIARGPIPIDETLAIVTQIAELSPGTRRRRRHLARVPPGRSSRLSSTGSRN